MVLFGFLGLIIQPRFNEYKKLFIISFSCFSSHYEQLKEKYVEITEKTGSDEMYALLDEVESDLDEVVYH